MATSILRRSTALTGGVLAVLITVTSPVLAGDGDGGRDANGNAGGAANASGRGNAPSGSAGGGAGTSGGSGGGAGGFGGATAGADGGDGGSLVMQSISGGGGGGAHGYVDAATLTAASTGGKGGKGAAQGGGGGGGFGASFVANSTTSVTISHNLTGGSGGDGGSAGGSGGNGGTGLAFTASGGRDLTIGSGVTIQGGAGGVGNGSGSVDGKGGAGISVAAAGASIVKIIVSDGATVLGGNGGGTFGLGASGIRGNNLNVILEGGSIVGSGAARAADAAIKFTGGTNRLELRKGYEIRGKVEVQGPAGTTGTLALGGAENDTFAFDEIQGLGNFRGFAAFEKTGASSWTLTGTGANSGGIRINVKQGRLAVDGNLSSNAVKVETNGILGGVGTVGVTTVVGGTLAPGNSIGTLTVNGNLSFDSASTYAVEVSPTASDRVDVSGTATLGGAKVATSFQPGTYVAKQYTVLNAAGGVIGAFGPKVDSNLPAGFKSTLRYDPKTVFLDLALDYTPPETKPEPEPETKPESKPEAGAASSPAATPATPPNRGLSPNQSSAANALTGYFNRTGGIPMAFGALTAQGLSQVAGEPVTAVQTNASAAVTQFMGALVDGVPGERGVALAAGPAGYASYSSAKGRTTDLPLRKAAITPDPDLWRWSVWGSGFGGVQFNGANAVAGTAAATNRIYGAAVGADYRLSPETTLGFALGGGATLFNSYGLGSGSSELFQAGLFLRRQFGASYLSASAAYAWQDVTTDRMIGTSEHLQGRFNANSYAGRIEAGHRLSLAGFGVTPYAAAQYSLLSLPGYRETALSGPGLFALAFAGKDTTRLRSELGLRLERQVDLGGFDLTLRAAAAWVATSNTKASASASFQTLPGASFLVQGAAPDRNALRTSAAAELKLSKALTLATSFEGEFAKNSRSLGGKAALRYTW